MNKFKLNRVSTKKKKTNNIQVKRDRIYNILR